MTNEENLILQYQNGDEKAFEKLLDSLKPIIHSAVSKFSKYAFHLGIDVKKSPQGTLNELEQECAIAILKLCKSYTFDIEKPLPYIYVCCKYAIINYIYQNKNKTSRHYNQTYLFPGQISMDTPIFQDNEESTLLNLIPDESSVLEYDEILNKIDNEILSKDIIKLFDETFQTDEYKKINLPLYGICEPQKSVQDICELLNLNIYELFDKEKECFNIIRNNPKCHWFIKKYAPEFFNDSLERIEQIQDPQKYCVMKELIKNEINKIFNQLRK